MAIGFTIQGLSELQVKLDTYSAAKAQQVADAIQGAGIDCQAQAKIACPVLSGRLRSSIQYVKTGPMICEVMTNVNYAPFVELGTHKQRPQPFLLPAYEEASRALQAELERIGKEPA